MVRIALIDSVVLRRECFMRVVADREPAIVFQPFASISDMLKGDQLGFDLVLLHSRIGSDLNFKEIAEIKTGLLAGSLIVISESRDANDTFYIRNAMQAGVSGFVSARTFSLSMTLSAIRFVHAGGTFAPREILLSRSETRPSMETKRELCGCLTPREQIVVALLQHGKSNKIIAYELNMSESSVKVHLCNIIRKLGAANRTQAALNARQLCSLRPSRETGVTA